MIKNKIINMIKEYKYVIIPGMQPRKIQTVKKIGKTTNNMKCNLIN